MPQKSSRSPMQVFLRAISDVSAAHAGVSEAIKNGTLSAGDKMAFEMLNASFKSSLKPSDPPQANPTK